MGKDHIYRIGSQGGVTFVPDDGSKLFKFPMGLPGTRRRTESEQCFAIERVIYDRLDNGCNHILQCFGTTEDRITLEFCEGGPLRGILRDSDSQYLSLEDRLRWALQVAEGLAFCHSKGILHADLGCSNIFLTRQHDAKLGDFGGSSIDGSLALVCYSESHQLPDDPNQPSSDTSNGVQVSVKTEIFAFGSTLYEIMTGSEPYAGRSDITELFQQGNFPDTGHLFLGRIMAKCWQTEYDSLNKVLENLRAEGEIKDLILSRH